jgi:hypothetical protein
VAPDLKSGSGGAVANTRRRESTTQTARQASRMNGSVRVGRGVKRRSARQRSRIPVRDSRGPVHVAWYVGVTVMALFEVIEWPLAIVIAVGHEIAHRSRNKALRELAEGIEAAG